MYDSELAFFEFVYFYSVVLCCSFEVIILIIESKEFRLQLIRKGWQFFSSDSHMRQKIKVSLSLTHNHCLHNRSVTFRLIHS